MTALGSKKYILTTIREQPAVKVKWYGLASKEATTADWYTVQNLTGTQARQLITKYNLSDSNPWVIA